MLKNLESGSLYSVLRMFHLVKSYFTFLLRSTNQHGVHSPFVYNLVTRCFYDRKKYPAYSILKNYRRSLLKDERSIMIKDFGAGSRIFKSDKREVSKMAKTAGISIKHARLLNRLVRYLNIDHALELGTALGMATAALAAGNRVEIATIEGCPETAKIAEEKFKEFGFDNVELKVRTFEKFLVEGGKWIEESHIENSKFKIQEEGNSKSQIPNLNSSTTDNPNFTIHNSALLTPKFDLLYIDGNHQREATIEYFEKLLPTIHNDSVMIFDDIHWSQGMEAAWEAIKAHPKVTVTIDTFQWGLVFFRREQEKEHFVIRV